MSFLRRDGFVRAGPPLEGEDGLERLGGRRPGGYHPIHLQDELCDGRYRVIHKLGCGGRASVWLCKDQHAEAPTYVAIKILVADEGMAFYNFDLQLSAYLRGYALGEGDALGENLAAAQLRFPRGHFDSNGPNGRHLSLVYPVLGPEVTWATKLFGSKEGMVQQVARHAVEALLLLHRRGTCHGAFCPSNILIGMESLDGLEVGEVLARLGEPKKSVPVDRLAPFDPNYLVFPVDLVEAAENLSFNPSVHLINFGQHFTTPEGPPARRGISHAYAAPEVVLGNIRPLAVDSWALGCTLYEIRMGRPLFSIRPSTPRESAKTVYMDEVSSLLGPPTIRWPERYRNFVPYSREQRLRSIRERIASCHDCRPECEHPRYELISEDETIDLADLLEGLLQYRAEERMRTREVLKHPWFNIMYKHSDKVS